MSKKYIGIYTSNKITQYCIVIATGLNDADRQVRKILDLNNIGNPTLLEIDILKKRSAEEIFKFFESGLL